MADQRLIVLTPGDPDGIGPEVTWKSIRKLRSGPALICVGAEAPFKRLKAPIHLLTREDLKDRRALVRRVSKKRGVWLVPAPTQSSRFLAGFQSGWSIEEATQLVQAGVADALVTGPISKE